MPWGVAAAVAGSVVSGVMSGDGGASDANAAAASANNMQAQIAKEQWDRYKTVFAPLEDSMISAAQNYDSPAQYERAAGEASGAVSQAYSNARDRLTRTPGLDPTSAAYTAGLSDLDRSQAAADAVSQNTARKNVQDTAWARKSDMLSLGKGLPAQASTGLAQVSSNSLNQAKYNYGVAANEAGAISATAKQIGTGLQSIWNGFGSNSNQSTAAQYGTNPGSQQTAMLAAQDFGL
ncbi:hypothetical protein BKK79_01030 [Cupriavidus sp. USMAA2-4]|uniref:hypothetical protein n=1 Tax=Cupriavidus sp. USMAA2-4 TaxID=876364 RepID=UPI0008A68914|nr:hypothetical protein [Cupriavidus sp. USMAA2-4]AOY90569.1 hypothetical protein BKK79_01030 [Cupriavidus sp. USMAA2-4]